MPSAAIVYWYAGDQLRMDGGGLRVVAWRSALEAHGYDVTIVPLWSIGGGVARGGRLSRVKRAVVPMPLTRRVPAEALAADLVVATVPAVFGDALDRVRPDRLVLDWMDLWSVNARNIGAAHPLSSPGGILQSRIWERRERRWVQRPALANTFAGYDDWNALVAEAGVAVWLPTPGALPADRRIRPRAVRRLGFIGNLDYPPNQLSLIRFIREHESDLAASGVTLVVAGFGAERMRLTSPVVEPMGEVESVADFYQSVDAVVVPVWHGGGIKVKAVEALAHGLPVFTTDHVRSGFHPSFHPYLLALEDIASSAEGSHLLPEALFSEWFTQEAFTRHVGDVLGSKSSRVAP